MLAQDREHLAGQHIGNYEVVSHIADHKISDLFLARDVKLDRLVYLERLRTSTEESVELAERFQRRMETVALLKHENIAVVSDVDVTDDGYVYAVTEYFPATPLSETLDRMRHEDKTQPTIAALELCKQVAQGLSVAHSQDLIHHDLRPENIMLREDGSPVLIDLGVPTSVSKANVGMARTEGEMLDYSSPEEVDGKPLTRRSNIYSLGVILYEFLAGHRPRLPEMPFDIFPQANMPKEEPLEEARPGLAGETYRLVRNCLWRQEWSRFETADEMVTAIETAIFAEQELPKAAVWTPRRRNPFLIAAPLALIALAALAFIFIRGGGDDEPPPTAIPATATTDGAGQIVVIEPTSASSEATATPTATATLVLPTEAPFNLSISVLAPPANREFSRQDVINFDWFWPTLPEPGQQFTVYISDAQQEYALGSLTEPNNGAAYRLQVGAGSLPTEASELSWQVRLENLGSGQVFVSSDAIPIRVLADEPTATPTVTIPALTGTSTVTATPTTTLTPTATASSTCVVSPPAGWFIYRVQRGDTLAQFALNADVTIGTIMRVNCLATDVLSIGQQIWVPSTAIVPTQPPVAPTQPPAATQPPAPTRPSGGGNTPAPPPTSTTAPPTVAPPTVEPTKTVPAPVED